MPHGRAASTHTPPLLRLRLLLRLLLLCLFCQSAGLAHAQLDEPDFRAGCPRNIVRYAATCASSPGFIGCEQAQSNFVGNGKGIRCPCQPGYAGLDCSICDRELAVRDQMLFQGIQQFSSCILCQCSPTGSANGTCSVSGRIGNRTTQCFCKTGFGGARCDECSNGKIGTLCDLCPRGTFPGPDGACKTCACNPLGSVLNETNCQADGGCQCKPGITGATCDTCALGFTGTFPNCQGNLFQQNKPTLIRLGGAAGVLVVLFAILFFCFPLANNLAIITMLLALGRMVTLSLLVFNVMTDKSHGYPSNVVMAVQLTVVLPTLFNWLWTIVNVLRELMAVAEFREWATGKGGQAALLPALVLMAATGGPTMIMVAWSKLFYLTAFSAQPDPPRRDFERRSILGQLIAVLLGDIPQFAVQIWLLTFSGPDKTDAVTIASTFLTALGVVYGLLTQLIACVGTTYGRRDAHSSSKIDLASEGSNKSRKEQFDANHPSRVQQPKPGYTTDRAYPVNDRHARGPRHGDHFA
ncbi:hypothetical protein BC831DRAFT_440147 [Entophlyctis helioformis]|nr:hypothetical protein BC831DRAFT_440147 [Entophlyctis helioformis]